MKEPMAPNITMTTNCKACHPLVEYLSRESKHDIKELEDNMFNPTFKKMVQGQKRPERYVVDWYIVKGVG